MATTPNFAAEVQAKQTLRSVSRGGSNPWYEGIDPAILVNAYSTTSGVLELAVPSTNTNFTISGSNTQVTSVLTPTTQVSGLVATLAATALSGIPFYVNAGSANYIGGTTTTIVVPSGAGLTVNNGAGTTPVLTNVVLQTVGTLTALTGTGTTWSGTVSGMQYPFSVGQVITIGTVTGTTISGFTGGSGTVTASTASGFVITNTTLSGSGFNSGQFPSATASNLSVAFPNYAGTPNATPTWIDDATAHVYPVSGIGAIVQDTTRTEQKQVRQISTNVSETQQYNGYFATYSGNLYQSGQKRTYRQQS